jgi:hypothetical protein
MVGIEVTGTYTANETDQVVETHDQRKHYPLLTKELAECSRRKVLKPRLDFVGFFFFFFGFLVSITLRILFRVDTQTH